LAKPFMQRFTGQELWDLDKLSKNSGNRCPACRSGDYRQSSHREIPNPCAFSVKLEILRRLNHYDDAIEALEEIASMRKWYR
jgi:hypothetical protein